MPSLYASRFRASEHASPYPNVVIETPALRVSMEDGLALMDKAEVLQRLRLVEQQV